MNTENTLKKKTNILEYNNSKGSSMNYNVIKNIYDRLLREGLLTKAEYDELVFTAMKEVGLQQESVCI